MQIESTETAEDQSSRDDSPLHSPEPESISSSGGERVKVKKLLNLYDFRVNYCSKLTKKILKCYQKYF